MWRYYWGPWGGAVQFYLHWSLPVVLLLFVTNHPGCALGLVLVWLVHLLAGVWAVRGLGGRVGTVLLSALGARVSARETLGVSGLAVIAWAGVGAQGVLALVWTALRLAMGFPQGEWYAAFDDALMHANVILIVANLLPWPGSAGARAWSLLVASHQVGRRAPPPSARKARTVVDPEAERRRAETERIFTKMLDELMAPIREDRGDDED